MKKTYVEAQRENDFAFQCWKARKEHIRQVREIDEESIKRWMDEELERKIVDYTLNQFDQAGKPPKEVNVNHWEKDILLKLPVGVQAVFATHLFESSFHPQPSGTAANNEAGIVSGTIEESLDPTY
ncbi:MAG TPA: hypothetical protein VF646_15535 [Cytophagales bacterium]